MKRVVLVIAAAVAMLCSTDGIPSAVANNTTSTMLPALQRWQRGDQITEHIDERDQIQWLLPKKRLEPFIRAGVIIKEDRLITTNVLATVDTVTANGSDLHIQQTTHTIDVPRKKDLTNQAAYSLALGLNNEPRARANDSDVAGSALFGLPITASHPGRVDQRWTTTVPVWTELGTGWVKFDHTITGVDNGLAAISVSGHGQVTGKEYHLPFLLPGDITMSGMAWYDPRDGIARQESYAIRVRIVKPAEGEQIGFDEQLSFDARSKLSRARTR